MVRRCWPSKIALGCNVPDWFSIACRTTAPRKCDAAAPVTSAPGHLAALSPPKEMLSCRTVRRIRRGHEEASYFDLKMAGCVEPVKPALTRENGPESLGQKGWDHSCFAP